MTRYHRAMLSPRKPQQPHAPGAGRSRYRSLRRSERAALPVLPPARSGDSEIPVEAGNPVRGLAIAAPIAAAFWIGIIVAAIHII